MKKFAIFAGKHLKAGNFIEKRLQSQIFSCEYCKILRSAFWSNTSGDCFCNWSIGSLDQLYLEKELIKPFMPLVTLYTPRKYQNTSGFLMLSGGIERDYRHEMGESFFFSGRWLMFLLVRAGMESHIVRNH